MMMFRMGAAAAGAVAAWAALGAPALAVTKEIKTVDGMRADVFTWKDAAGLKRSVALKKQGSGNDGNGGYAIQMTYKYAGDGKPVTVRASAPQGDGFGYFVSHERFRKFTDGDSQTISRKIFGKDDSPLGRQFSVKTRPGSDGRRFKSISFSLTYPRYGTKKPGGINTNTGEDQPPIGTNKALFDLYDLPVTITWSFEDGRSYPRIRTSVDLSRLPGPNRASFDLRGPYGKLDFDEGTGAIGRVFWGDRYHFNTTSAVVTRNSQWVWDQQNGDSRYVALTIGQREMGLFEPRFYAASAINDGFAFGRGKTYATHDQAGAGCPNQELPCDYEWPYQSTQYELPYDNPNGATTSEKIAWGSTPFYGMTLPATYDGVASTPFDGFPKNRKITYDVCVVLGLTVAGSLTRFDSSLGPDRNCARAD